MKVPVKLLIEPRVSLDDSQLIINCRLIDGNGETVQEFGDYPMEEGQRLEFGPTLVEASCDASIESSWSDVAPYHAPTAASDLPEHEETPKLDPAKPSSSRAIPAPEPKPVEPPKQPDPSPLPRNPAMPRRGPRPAQPR